jgi:hypothetical protein
VFWGGSIDDGPGVSGTGLFVGGGSQGLNSWKGFLVEGKDNSGADTGYNLAIGQPGQLSVAGSEVVDHSTPGGDSYRIGFGGTGYSSTSLPLQRINNNAIVVEQWGQSNDSGSLGPNHHYIYRLYLGRGNFHARRLDYLDDPDPANNYNGQTTQVGDIFLLGFTAGGPAGLIANNASVIGSGATFNAWGLISNDSVGNAYTIKQLRQGAPNTQTGSTYAVVDSDASVIFNASGTCTVTLPSPSSYTGRWLTFRTIANQTVVSASSNVVPLAGGAAGTAILAATAGKWADLQSDGSNWQIMMAN